MENRESRSRLKMLYAASSVTLVIYYFIGYFVLKQPGLPKLDLKPDVLNLLMMVFALFSVLLLPLGFFIKKKLADREGTAGRVLSPGLINMGLCHDPAIFGLVMVILTGNMDYYLPFAAWSIVMYMVFWPRD